MGVSGIREVSFDIERLIRAAESRTLHEEMFLQRAAAVARNYEEFRTLMSFFGGQDGLSDEVFKGWQYKLSIANRDKTAAKYVNGLAVNVERYSTITGPRYRFGWCYTKYYEAHSYKCFDVSDIIFALAGETVEFGDLF